MRTEGLKSLLVITLTTQAGTRGVLVEGWRARRDFKAEELYLAVAIGNQVSTALDYSLFVHARRDNPANAASDYWSLGQEKQRQNSYMRAVDAVGRAMRESFDLQEQVARLRQQMKDWLSGCDFALAMQESPKAPLETVVPFPQFTLAGAKPNIEASGLEKEVVRRNMPILIVESWQWARYPSAFPPGTPRIGTWCGVPIYFSDGTKGVLSAANFEQERALSDSEVELICALAREAAGAFESARTFQREQRRASQLALLNEIGRKATSLLNTEELLPNICTQAREALGHDCVRLEVWDRHRDELVVKAAAGYAENLAGRRTRLGKGLSGIAAEERRPVVTNRDPDHPKSTLLAPDIGSSVSLPLLYQDDLLGVFTVESRRNEAFSAQDILTLKTLADQLAIALHNACAFQNALQESFTDGLTGLKTHRYFMESLEREVSRSKRSGRPFAVAMIDLDRFKPVNDRHGHLEGDKVLRAVAKLFSSQVRQSSLLARYGGDEFSLLLPDTTEEQAQILAERMRASIEKEPILTMHHITASFGIAAYPQDGTTSKEILQAADTGMYVAKHQSGNRVREATPVSESAQIGAYLGVELKRKFATGPEAFNQMLKQVQTVAKTDNDVKVVDAVTALARTIDLSDQYTRDHSEAVSRVATRIARQMGLPDKEVVEIRRAAILHDIGKIGIPDAILHKPGALTAEEFSIVKAHSPNGQKILEPLKVDAMNRIALMVRHHHEKFEGGGYPDGLKGHDIPLGARIVTLADSFDTMVSARGYKKTRTLEEAVAELLRCRNTHFDPEIVEAFLKSLEAYGDPRGNAAWDDESVAIEEIAAEIVSPHF